MEGLSSAVFRVKAMERAVHDHGPWTMEWGPLVAPCSRLVTAHEVSFTAEFPAACHLGAPRHWMLVLRCGEDIVDVRQITDPGEGGWLALWKYKTEDLVLTTS